MIGQAVGSKHFHSEKVIPEVFLYPFTFWRIEHFEDIFGAKLKKNKQTF